MKNSRRNQMELKFTVMIDNRMAGIVAALKTDNPDGLLGQGINDPSFPFITPLCSHNGGYSHGIFSFQPLPHTSQYSGRRPSSSRAWRQSGHSSFNGQSYCQ